MGNCNVVRAGAACSVWHHEPRCCRRVGGGVEAGVRTHVVELGPWLGCKSQLRVATPSNITLPPCENKTRKLSHAFIPHPPPPGQSHPPCLQQQVLADATSAPFRVAAGALSAATSAPFRVATGALSAATSASFVDARHVGMQLRVSENVLFRRIRPFPGLRSLVDCHNYSHHSPNANYWNLHNHHNHNHHHHPLSSPL